MSELENEEWRNIPRYKGIYQISNLGRVRSLARVIKMKNKGNYPVKEKILRQSLNGAGYRIVNLYRNGKGTTKQVHQLVAIAFLRHRPSKHDLVVNHKDLDRLNNNLSNLEIITQRENSNRKHLKSSTDYVGVYKIKGSKRYYARISVKGKVKYLGTFDTPEEASKAYEKAAKEIKKRNNKLRRKNRLSTQ